jgi:hypothetical protein
LGLSMKGVSFLLLYRRGYEIIFTRSNKRNSQGAER